MHENKLIRCTHTLTHMYIHVIPSIPAEPTLPVPFASLMRIRKEKRTCMVETNESTSGCISRIPQ